MSHLNTKYGYVGAFEETKALANELWWRDDDEEIEI
jgi:hypothetical protein